MTTKTRITKHKTILSTLNEEIGEIFLTNCSNKKGIKIHHIEFKIFDDYEHYKNKGIMTKAVADYLQYCKEGNINSLIAIVKKDNIASVRVLEKNNFAKLQELEKFYIYVIDLRFEPDFTKKTIQEFQKRIF